MSEARDRFATPNSSKLAHILLQLKDQDAPAGLCNLDNAAASSWPQSYGVENGELFQTMIEASQQQDTCNCRKSKCLKLYCQCFAARAVCSGLCRCVTCENRPDNAGVREAAVNAILDRNPNAFDSKYRPCLPAQGGAAPVSSIAHKNGCRCRKSMCLKKYCECFQGGVPCSSICTCLTCHNTVGPVPSYDAGALLEQQEKLEVEAEVLADAAAAADEGRGMTRMMTDDEKFDEAAAQEARAHFAAPVQKTTPEEPERTAAAKIAGVAGGRKPPLVPHHKRKRESGADVGGPKAPHASFLGTSSSPMMGMGAVPSLFGAPTPPQHSDPHIPLPTSRAAQQQLLEQLLYQELESQGLLSSPFVSFVNTNCPGLLQGSPFVADGATGQAQAGGTAVQTRAQPLVATSTPTHPAAAMLPSAGTGSRSDSFSAPALALCNPPADSTGDPAARGLRAPSPTTISIATALALLAANAQAQQLHNHHQQFQQQGGIADNGDSAAVRTSDTPFDIDGAASASSKGLELAVPKPEPFSRAEGEWESKGETTELQQKEQQQQCQQQRDFESDAHLLGGHRVVPFHQQQ